MNEILGFLFKRLAPLWHKREIALALAFVASLAVFFWSAQTGVAQITPLGLAASITTGLLIVAIWMLTHRIPQTPKGKVGIVLAITSDEETEAKQIRTDFIHVLRQLLQQDPTGANFHVLLLPSFATEGITDLGGADRILRKARGHFMLYGDARRREFQGKPVHLLRLEGAVRHTTVPKEVSQRLSQDLREALPRGLIVPRDGDAFAFETTSAWVNLSARYIVAIAAFLSGAAGYAEKLFLDVEASLRSADHLPAVLQPMARSLPHRIMQLYHDWGSAVADRYFMTRERAYVIKMDEIAGKLLDRNPQHYGALLSKAVTDFILRRDLNGARDAIERAQRKEDVTWRYSLAFLHAYQGDLDAAHEEYRKAFRGPIQNVTVPIQSEEFIHIVFEEEPDKHELQFCLGLINYNAKKDFAAAQRDFSRFLESPVSEKFPSARGIAQNLLERSRERTPPPENA